MFYDCTGPYCTAGHSCQLEPLRVTNRSDRDFTNSVPKPFAHQQVACSVFLTRLLEHGMAVHGPSHIP